MSSMQEEERNKIALTVNGVLYELEVGTGPAQVAPSHRLAHTLRETLDFTGTKVGCDQGVCGSCTVIMDADPVLSRMAPVYRKRCLF